MKICFLARPSFDVYSSELFKKLKKLDKSIEAIFVTTNAKESGTVKKLVEGYNGYSVVETAPFFEKHWKDYDLDALRMYEQKYDCCPVWKYIYSDRFLIHRDYEYNIKIAVGLFSFFEEIFNNSVDYYYSECIATLQCYIAYIVGEKIGVKYLTQMTARGNLDSTFHYFTDNPFQYNCELNDNYLEISFSHDETIMADKYLSDFEKNDSPPPAMQLVRTRPKIDKQFILAPFRYLVHRFDSELNNPYAYMYYRSYSNCLEPIIFYFRYKKMKKYFVKADYKRKYVYFPLHYQPEASTLVCAEKYEKQLYYIDSFAKSLPADTVLYVKEHYTLLGHKKLEFYKNLQNYPNVFLIDPWENSRKLIMNATAVTTLTGTAGLEAMLLRKPVIVGGNAIYEKAPGVIKVEDIYDNYISAINSWRKPSRDEIIKYLCACYRTYRKGNVYCQNRHELINENIEDISLALYEKLLEGIHL